jgi:LicD family
MFLSNLNRFLTGIAEFCGVSPSTILRLRMRARTLFLLPRYRYQKNLQLLHDALSHTGFGDRYWISFGLLLGWARDGHPIPWDFRDADFVYATSDHDLFLEQAKPALLAAGFELLRTWTNNSGMITEHVFYRDKARFEFFEMYEDAEGSYYFSYGKHQGSWCEMVCRLPNHGLESIGYLGRIWMKPDNHAEYLERVYGNWRVPRPDHDYAEDDKNICKIEAYDEAAIGTA